MGDMQMGRKINKKNSVKKHPKKILQRECCKEKYRVKRSIGQKNGDILR